MYIIIILFVIFIECYIPSVSFQNEFRNINNVPGETRAFILRLFILFYFKVIKDSKAVAEKWRTMDGDKIAIIEKACSEFLKTFDYELFDGNT